MLKIPEKLKDRRRLLAAAAGVLVLLILLLGIRLGKKAGAARNAENGGDASGSTAESAAEDAVPEGESLTILCCGDNLMHRQLYENAFTGDGYDFTPYYVHVKEQVQAADIATVNQETPLASDLYELSTYPRFNSPKAVGAALLDTGFDVINLGNNHIYDCGSDGAAATKNYFDERDVPVVGVYDSYDDMMDIRVVEKNGIRVAFLGFTESTNQPPDGEGADIVWMDDRQTASAQIARAKEVSDVLCAHVHWGEEGTTQLTDRQKAYAQFLVDEGVDIIFGNHPHWLQKLTVLTRASDGAKCPVIFSLGNFVSGMDRREEIVTGFLTVQVTKDASTGEVRPTAMEFTPLVLHFSSKEKTDLAIWPLAEYTAEMAEANYVNELRGTFSLEFIRHVIDKSIPKKYQNKMGKLD